MDLNIINVKSKKKFKNVDKESFIFEFENNHLDF